MKPYLKLRTFIVLLVLFTFALAIQPLTPLDFFTVFKHSVKPEHQREAASLVMAAQARQTTRPDLYPATALLEAANLAEVNLPKLTDCYEARDNSDVVAQLRKRAASSIRLGLDLNGGVEFILKLNPDYSMLTANDQSLAEQTRLLEQNFGRYRDFAMEALRKRLETQNIFETELAPFAAKGLSLKAPLVSKDEKDKLQQLIQMSSKLEFRLVHPDSAQILQTQAALPLGYEVLAEAGSATADAPRNTYVVAKACEMTGRGIENAFVAKNNYQQIGIALHFNAAGASEFAEVTARNLHRQLAIVLNGRLYCAPVIQSEITGGQAEITGHFSNEEAQNIADVLNSGSFPFKIDVEAVYDTEPTLGADNVQNGLRAGLLALVILGAFMIWYYRESGVIAVLALSANVVLILGAMAAFGATLTMPGIAGIILTLGMAVDANVLVFERMREETEAGKAPDTVVELGFQRAYSAVLDGNLTTLIVAVILMYFGTGAIKGFAVSLSIGILASLFTALFMSKVLFDWRLRWKPLNAFKMKRFLSKPAVPFVRQSKLAIPISLLLILLSISFCLARGEKLFSVDFTGGTLLSYQYNQSVPVSDLEQFLTKQKLPGKVSYKTNAASRDNRKLEILLSPEAVGSAVNSQQVSENLRQQLNSAYPTLQLSDGQLTSIGGMVGAEMSKNALLSLLLSFAGMIVYVAIRYEFHYAVAGILALLHDVIIALGIFALTGRELSLPVVAGLLTIIGYSINDTIVIFDRIREERKLHLELPFAKIVDYSLNCTLSRTLLTSLTTFLVVVVLFSYGGVAVNDFMLIIGLGIIVGSYSSLYLAAPLVSFYQDYQTRRQQLKSGNHQSCRQN